MKRSEGQALKTITNVFDLDTFFSNEFAEHQEVFTKTQVAVQDAFAHLVTAAAESIRNGGKLIFFGNGGSAADAQHLATELTVRYRHNRPAIAAIALTTDTSALTAIGNDLGFEHLFSRQLEAIAKPDDLIIAISTSGKSPNVIEALKTAQTLKIKAAGFTGGDGGLMKDYADPLLIVPSKTTSRIQEMHIFLGQMLCAALEYALGLDEESLKK